MNLKDAILKSLEHFARPVSSTEIGNYILENRMVNFKTKTPLATVSAHCGWFIRHNDNRLNVTKKTRHTITIFRGMKKW